jgi:uncharacterized protein (TIGR02231 family)
MSAPFVHRCSFLGGVVVVAVVVSAGGPAFAEPVGGTAGAGRVDRLDRVDRVVVFADRAEVRRVATARCDGDAVAVVFADLPSALDGRTLRAEAKGAEAVGVSTTRVERTASADERVRALQDELRAVDVAIATRQRAQADDDERVRSSAGYGGWFRAAVSEELRAGKPDIARFEQLLSMLTTETQTHATTRVARAAELRDLQRRRQRIALRLDHLGAAEIGAGPRLDATVGLRCSRGTTPSVFLSYVVPAAGWRPEYDLRWASTSGKKTGDGTVTLTVSGVITQASGEDWDDAELWLSTAKPRLGGEAPLPNPIWLNAAPETRGKTLVQQQEERAEDLGRGATGAVVVPEAASLEDGGKAFVLNLPRRVTVRADGRPYWFPVDDVSGKAMASLVAVPTLNGSVHRVVTFTNPAPYPLLAAPVHVFRGATFVGDEAVEYRAPGEPVELSLGVDDDVTIERVDLLGGVRGSPFLSGQQTIAHAMRTQLHNRSNEDVVVELREQIPVSKTSQVTVTLQADKTSAAYALDAVRGHVTWRVALKKGLKDHRDLAFTIALPRDWTVN